MGTLTGQQINNTYDGLLKLSNSTTGITTSLQAIEDGLGNNTGLRIATNSLQGPTIYPMNWNNLGTPDFMGTGFGTTGSGAFAANTQNRLTFSQFYDPGIHSYSAITVNLLSASTTSDVVSFYFYTPQIVNGYGVTPKDLIMSGISIPSTGSTGARTISLPSTLSFSGTGGGYYICAFYISNANVTPTVRYTSPQIATFLNHHTALGLGFYQTAAGTSIGVGGRVASSGNNWVTINNLPVQASYTSSDISSNYGTTSQNIGFALNCIK